MNEHYYLAQWRAVAGDDHPLNHWLSSMFEQWNPDHHEYQVQEFDSQEAAEKAIENHPMNFGEFRILQVEVVYTVVSTTTKKDSA